uniref:Uncharacterized protein n=1 Tax=Rhizophora mucronata TaxID=61149 RepID=A0A2P2IHH8_RHIMU
MVLYSPDHLYIISFTSRSFRLFLWCFELLITNELHKTRESNIGICLLVRLIFPFRNNVVFYAG